MWEGGCSIEGTTGLKGLDAIILDLRCSSEGEDQGRSRQLLLRLPEGRIVKFPPFEILAACSGLPKGEEACDCNWMIFRSLPDDPSVSGYQELQFTDGLISGNAEIRQYRDGKHIWTAHGQHTCSNGDVICRVSFPVMQGGEVEEDFEIVGDDKGSLLVIPSFDQNVHFGEKFAVDAGKNYGGLVANLLNGFAPKADELVLPTNVYRYSRCAQ